MVVSCSCQDEVVREDMLHCVISGVPSLDSLGSDSRSKRASTWLDVRVAEDRVADCEGPRVVTLMERWARSAGREVLEVPFTEMRVALMLWRFE